MISSYRQNKIHNEMKQLEQTLRDQTTKQLDERAKL
jgi:hypothetical protein